MRRHRRREQLSVAVELRVAAAKRLANEGADPWREIDIALTWLAIAEDKLDEFLRFRAASQRVCNLDDFRMKRATK